MEKVSKVNLMTSKHKQSDINGILIIMSVLGINNRINTELFKKCTFIRDLMCPFGVICHLCFIYCTTILYCWGEFPPNKVLITSEMCFVFSLFIWYNLISHKKRYLEIKRIIGKLRWLMNLNNFKQKRLFDVITVSSVMLPLILTTTLFVVSRNDEHFRYNNFYVFGYTLESTPILQEILVFIGMLAFFSLRFFIPTVYVSIHGIMSYKLTKSIRHQANIIEKRIFTQSFNEEIRIYRLVIQTCRTFEECSRGSLFWILCLYFMVIYIGLGLSFDNNDQEVIIAIWTESFISISLSGLSMVALIAFASGIPTAMREKSLRFKDIYQNIFLEDTTKARLNSKRMKIINSLSSVDPVYLTVYGMLKVDKSLILSTFGCAITYCILIMQLKTGNDK